MRPTSAMRALYKCYGGAIQALDKAMRGVGGSYKASISALDERSEGAIRALSKVQVQVQVQS